ncbi:protein kinase [Helicobacter cetorum]|uniref:Protein kinase domain-containing protein n=1 Tax=Helicobacter cetorum (strain ATCC BAA-429 / MIT 00-7128) TaxID=182217 RepID=I0ENW3_HELC0|nr:protein kinase [Helicobacter cetorum]AFI04632.1 putative Protein kinase [Helicobacter cetorum MIT 00-7128]
MNSYFTTKNQKIELSKKLNKGGEGEVYEIINSASSLGFSFNAHQIHQNTPLELKNFKTKIKEKALQQSITHYANKSKNFNKENLDFFSAKLLKAPTQKTFSSPKIKALEQILHKIGSSQTSTQTIELVAKIFTFNDDNKTPQEKEQKLQELEQKLNFMLQNPINDTAIYYPLKLLYDGQRRFKGYLMLKANGMMFKDVFAGNKIKTAFPNITKRDLIIIALNWLKKIEILHAKNILVGDINPKNIMMNENYEVFLIDTDSYQMGSFLCKVGFGAFVSKELLESGAKSKNGKEHYTKTRDLSDEYYAIAVMIFYILMLGFSPYSHKNEDKERENKPEENTLKGYFPYSVQKINGGYGDKIPAIKGKKFLEHCWSHLHDDIKLAFYESFNPQGRYYAPNNRLSPKAWINLLEIYQRDLNNLIQKDSLANSVIPSRLRNY